MVGGFERDQPTGLGGQPLLQAAVPGLTDAFIHNPSATPPSLDKSPDCSSDLCGRSCCQRNVLDIEIEDRQPP